MNPKVRISIFIVLIIVIYFSSIAIATDVAINKQIDLFIKAMGHNRTLLKLDVENIRIGILCNSKDEKSKAQMVTVSDGFYEHVVAKTKIGDKPILYSILEFSSTERLINNIKQLGVTALFILAGNEKNISSIVKAANSSKIITFSGDSNYLNHGIATGVEDVGGKIKFVINLASAKEQGANFKAGLLKLSKIIK